jgi:hypothetical protein
LACLTKAALGGKTRVSCKTDSIILVDMHSSSYGAQNGNLGT